MLSSWCAVVGGIFATALLAILRKKVGKPKEEMRNLYGFHMNSSSDEFTCTNSYIWIHLSNEFILYEYISSTVHKGYFHGHNTLPLHGKTCSAIDEQTENGSRKNPPTTHSNVRWRKRIRSKKWKLQYNSCQELSSQGYVEWSTIRQNPAYVDAFSNTFRQ